MEYALLIYGDEKVWEAQDEDERRENESRHGRFARMLQARDAMRGGKELALASNATTLRHRGDEVSVTDGPVVGDERLRLLFACCHPALSADARAALMLRFVGGLRTAEIARLFLRGDYHLQALIAAEHSSAGPTDWQRIARLYAELERRTGSPVVRLNRAVAITEAGSPEAALSLLDASTRRCPRITSCRRPGPSCCSRSAGGRRRRARSMRRYDWFAPILNGRIWNAGVPSCQA